MAPACVTLLVATLCPVDRDSSIPAVAAASESASSVDLASEPPTEVQVLPSSGGIACWKCNRVSLPGWQLEVLVELGAAGRCAKNQFVFRGVFCIGCIVYSDV